MTGSKCLRASDMNIANRILASMQACIISSKENNRSISKNNKNPFAGKIQHVAHVKHTCMHRCLLFRNLWNEDPEDPTALM
jgi:hypothetical protein